MARRRETPLDDLLTERELAVLRLIAEGRANKAIAETLVVSVKTVEDHSRSLFAKLASPPRPATTSGCWPCSSGSGAPDDPHPTGAMTATARPPASPRSLSPGTVPPWQAAAARTALVTAAVLAFGAAAQWPMVGSRPWLFTSNLLVSGGFAVGSVLVSDEPRHAATRRALLIASILWSVAWVQVWKTGPLPLIASLTGPAPAAVAIWGLLQFPQPWRSRGAARAVLTLLVLMQAASFALTTFTEDNPVGWWPRIDAPSAHAFC